METEINNQHFTFQLATYTVIASMVGTGVLTTSGYILRDVNSYATLLTLWIIGGIVALCGALTMSEMASAIPRAGGDYNYIRRGLGDGPAAVYGWIMVIVGYAAPVALVSYTIANYTSSSIWQYFNWPSTTSPNVVNATLASVIIAGFTLTHCLGHRESERIQSWSTIFKLFIFASMLAAPAFIESRPLTAISSDLLAPPNTQNLGSALILVMFAYTGWNAAVYLSGEMQSAEHEVPRALVVGTVLVTGLYVILNLYYMAGVSLDQIQTADEDTVGRIALLANEHFFSPAVQQLLTWLLSLGMLASVSAFTITGPRILQVMACDGLAPSSWAKVHPTRKIPVRAVIIQGLLSTGFLWTGTFSQLLEVTGFGLGLMSLLAVGVIFKLRRLPDYNPSFSNPLGNWGAVIFIGVNAWMLLDAGFHNPRNAIISCAIIMSTVAVYYGFKRS